MPFHKSKAGQYSALALLVCCCCCIGALGIAGSLSFAIYTGVINVNINGVNNNNNNNGVGAAVPTKIAADNDGLSHAEIVQQAKAAAREHHEMNQEMVELANKKAILQQADSNPHLDVDLDNIATILPVVAKADDAAAAAATTNAKTTTLKTNKEEEELMAIEKKEKEALRGGGGDNESKKKEKEWHFDEIKFKVPDEKENNKPFIARDAEGDRVMDDMLAKDIAAGRVVDKAGIELMFA